MQTTLQDELSKLNGLEPKKRKAKTAQLLKELLDSFGGQIDLLESWITYNFGKSALSEFKLPKALVQSTVEYKERKDRIVATLVSIYSRPFLEGTGLDKLSREILQKLRRVVIEKRLKREVFLQHINKLRLKDHIAGIGSASIRSIGNTISSDNLYGLIETPEHGGQVDDGSTLAIQDWLEPCYCLLLSFKPADHARIVKHFALKEDENGVIVRNATSMQLERKDCCPPASPSASSDDSQPQGPSEHSSHTSRRKQQVVLKQQGQAVITGARRSARSSEKSAASKTGPLASLSTMAAPYARSGSHRRAASTALLQSISDDSSSSDATVDSTSSGRRSEVGRSSGLLRGRRQHVDDTGSARQNVARSRTSKDGCVHCRGPCRQAIQPSHPIPRDLAIRHEEAAHCSLLAKEIYADCFPSLKHRIRFATIGEPDISGRAPKGVQILRMTDQQMVNMKDFMTPILIARQPDFVECSAADYANALSCYFPDSKTSVRKGHDTVPVKMSLSEFSTAAQASPSMQNVLSKKAGAEELVLLNALSLPSVLGAEARFKAHPQCRALEALVAAGKETSDRFIRKEELRHRELTVRAEAVQGSVEYVVNERADVQSCLTFNLWGTAGCVSPWHRDVLGMTYVTAHGPDSKLWTFALNLSTDDLAEFERTGDRWDPPEDKLFSILLQPGETLVFGPVPHFVLTLVAAPLSGGMFWHIDHLSSHIEYVLETIKHPNCSNEDLPREIISVLAAVERMGGTTPQIGDVRKTAKAAKHELEELWRDHNDWGGTSTSCKRQKKQKR